MGLHIPDRLFCESEILCHVNIITARLALLLLAIYTINTALLALGIRILVYRRQARKLITLDFAFALLSVITGLTAAFLAIFESSFFAKIHLHIGINTIAQFFSSIGTALAEISIFFLLRRRPLDVRVGTHCLHSVIFALCMTNLLLSVWPILVCHPVGDPADGTPRHCVAPSRQLAWIWLQGALLALTFFLLPFAAVLGKSDPPAKPTPRWRHALVFSSFSLAGIFSLARAAWLTTQGKAMHRTDPSNDLNIRGHLIACGFGLIIFSMAIVAANSLAINRAPVKPTGPETKEHDSAPGDQVDGPAYCPPTAERDGRDSLLVIQGPRVPGYRETMDQNPPALEDAYLGWGNARMTTEHEAWSSPRVVSRENPPTAGILKTVSVDVVVEDRDEDQWHDAERGEHGPHDWQAVLRRGPD